MDAFKDRTIKFKAWNTSARLLLRLDAIECTKGELHKHDHILLQFTGLCDMEGEEIYDQDIVLIGYTQYRIFWEEKKNGWYFCPLKKPLEKAPFISGQQAGMKRFCSWFELNAGN